MTAVALAEFLILKADPQATVLHNSRYSQTNIRAAYAQARAGFRAYNTDPLRRVAGLNKVKENLLRKAADVDLKPRQRTILQNSVELIDLFQIRENALGLRALPLTKARTFAPLMIAGVELSVQPDFMVEPVTKAPDPDACRLDATKQQRGDHRREMGRYLVAMLEVLLAAQPEMRARLDRDLIFVSDIRLGERIGAGGDHTSRIRDIEAACQQVAALWDGVKPRPAIMLKPDADDDLVG